MKQERIVEYWESKNLPSMSKTSKDFGNMLEARFNEKGMMELMAAPFLDREEIERRQLLQIQGLVEIAYEKTSFYRRKYDAAGFTPGDLKTWEDYHHLPLVTKDELIEAFPDKCINIDFDHDDLFPTRSSGSSGKTLKILVDPEAIIIDTLQGIRQFWLQSGGSYSAEHVLTHVYTVPWWIDHLSEGLYQNIFISSLIPPEEIGGILQEVASDILSLYPSNLASLLPYLPDQTRKKIFLTVTHSEMSSREERKLYSQALGSPVLDEYSSEELTRIALELPTSGRYHVCEDAVRLDVLDSDSMQVIEQGTGLVVATNLLNIAMPFIRYIQGDNVTIGEQIPSHVKWKQIERIEGRLNDSFLRIDCSEVPTGTILDVTYRWMFDIGINIEEFEIIQTTRTSIVINVNDPELKDDLNSIRKSRQHIKKLLEHVLQGEIELQFNIVDKIEKVGKKRRPIRREFK